MSNDGTNTYPGINKYMSSIKSILQGLKHAKPAGCRYLLFLLCITTKTIGFNICQEQNSKLLPYILVLMPLIQYKSQTSITHSR